jgi:hypothetical protein
VNPVILGSGIPLFSGATKRAAMSDLVQVSGYVPDGVGVVPGSGVRVLAHLLRIREGGQNP